MGIEHLYVREPGGTTISELIRAILLDNSNSEMHARTELLLYAAARAQIVEQVIRPALIVGKVVICDRYTDSTAAYQGYGRRLDLNLIDAAIRLATNDLQADLTLFFDVSLETAEKRRRTGGKSDDRLEAENREFHARVRSGYLQLAKKYAHRFVTIDAEQGIEAQQQTVWQAVCEKAKKAEFKMEAF